jgi:hypothetical protein
MSGPVAEDRPLAGLLTGSHRTPSLFGRPPGRSPSRADAIPRTPLSEGWPSVAGRHVIGPTGTLLVWVDEARVRPGVLRAAA